MSSTRPFKSLTSILVLATCACGAGIVGGADEERTEGAATSADAAARKVASSGTFGDAGPQPSSANDAACVSVSSRAEAVRLPADIVWIVDQSGSMDQEAGYVQKQINAFAGLIERSGIDYRVVMIASSRDGQAICVPPPLGDGACGDTERFKQVDVFVDSNDPLSVAIAQYPTYATFLRRDAVKHFVFVSDDNPDAPPIDSAAAFLAALEAAPPAGTFARTQAHAIYAYGSVPFVGCLGVFGIGAAVGTIYTDLVNATQGARGQICSGDWRPVFDAITASVVASSKVDCSYAIPSEQTAGGPIDTARVNVAYLAAGQAPGAVVPQVKTSSECDLGATPGGWYFDVTAAPKQVILCPQTCAVAQADTAAQMNLQFGCESITKIR